jgi:hypothetical protein
MTLTTLSPRPNNSTPESPPAGVVAPSQKTSTMSKTAAVAQAANDQHSLKRNSSYIAEEAISLN